MNHIEGNLTGNSGLSLYWQCWAPSRTPRGVVVVAHGLGEHGGRYRRIAERLVADGLVVYAIDHRGHGRSDGRRAMLDRFRFAVEDLDKLVELAREKTAGGTAKPLPTYLLGHSMGGGIAVAYALRFQEKLDGLILSGPAVSAEGAPWLVRVLAQALTNLLPRLPLFAVDPALVSRDPAEVRAYAEDPLNMHGKVPLRTVAEILTASSWLPKAVDGLRLPLLVVHGSEDKLVPVAVGRMVHERAASADKTLEIFDGFYHEILNEPPADRERVTVTLLDWLRARLPAAV